MLHHWVLPLTGRLKSVGRRQLQLASYQSLEHWEQILSQLPDDWEKNTAGKISQLSQKQQNPNEKKDTKIPFTANMSHINTLLSLSTRGRV